MPGSDDTNDTMLRELLQRRRRDGDDAGPTHDAWLALAAKAPDATLAYLLGTAGNLRRQRRRADQRRTRREHEWATCHATPGAAPDASLDAEQTREALCAALDRLDPDTRNLVVARYVDGKRAEALAAELGVAANTLRWRLKRALDQLRILCVPAFEESMTPSDELRVVLEELERRLRTLGNEWSGRLVVHLDPSPATTDVTQVEFVPPASRALSRRTRARLTQSPLPGCRGCRPFEMHFECTTDAGSATQPVD